jgi:hypothetical protein
MKPRDPHCRFSNVLRSASPSPADHFAAIWGELTEEQRAVLESRLEQVFAKRQGARLEQAANEGRVPRCDQCGRPMALRTSRYGGRFWDVADTPTAAKQ